ncbi:MAG: PTS sugar transporter subunit IIA [Spirochaetaceae bacterium]|jgi:mannitol/fructose-specific phosphotransferase system IIA component (Ntr-type)|nr:PTS sugar transporter subunit IIA [Spirochaetaceae bacterium]
MILADVFDERLIKLDLEGTDKTTVFQELVEAIAAVKPELSREDMLSALHDREAKMQTALSGGIAVPHGYFHGLKGIIGALGFSRDGIDYGVSEAEPVHLVVMLLLGEGEHERHLRVLSRILTLIESGTLSQIKDSPNPHEVYKILCKVG